MLSTLYYIILSNVVTRSDQQCNHPDATLSHTTELTIKKKEKRLFHALSLIYLIAFRLHLRPICLLAVRNMLYFVWEK